MPVQSRPQRLMAPLLVALLTSLFPGVSHASEELALGDWLARPGVRMVAVEFYATWCKPCMEAMPRWAALKAKYRKQGVRVIVVNTLDPEGGCRAIGWSPDDTVCDLDGHIAEAFALKGKLPAAYLWSWQGNLLVQKGHVGEVEQAIAAYLQEAPRVAIAGAPGIGPEVLAALRERLDDSGKITVIAGDEERKMLAASKKAQQGAAFDEKLQCELGKEVPANAILRVSKVAQGKAAFLNVAVYDLAGGCQTQVVSAPWDSDARAMAQEAVGKLLAKLKRDGLEMPASAKVAKRIQAVTPERPNGPQVEGGDVAVEDGQPARRPKVGGAKIADAVGRLIVTVQPKDATLEISGPGKFSETARGDWENAQLAPGKYRVMASLAGYETKKQQVEVVVDDLTTAKLKLDKLGVLEVTGTPPGTRVEIRGPEGFAVTKVLPVTIKDAPKGTYTIAASKAGFEAESYSAMVQLAATAQVAVALKAPGSLVVEGTPAGAKVEVTGPGGFATTQGLPLSIDAASRGSYQIKVSRPGYVARTFEARVVPGEKAAVAVKLEREGAAAGAGSAAAAGQGWVHIAPGTFTMGSPVSEGRRNSDETQHQVTISRPFLMQATEVTQGQWQAVMGSNPAKFKACGPQCPVEQVSWLDAIVYLNKLSQREGLQACYGSDGAFVGPHCTGYRLPTEAEWEYAARAGTTGARYGDLERVAWYSRNSGAVTHPVATKQANAWGLFDMLGNVWEWTGDWKAGYDDMVTDPQGAASGSLRVLRGGSWYYDDGSVRAASRNGIVPDFWTFNLGFRPVRSVP